MSSRCKILKQVIDLTHTMPFKDRIVNPHFVSSIRPVLLSHFGTDILAMISTKNLRSLTYHSIQMHHVWLGLLFFLTIGLPLFGQNLNNISRPFVRSFTPSDYKAQNQNWSIAQSPEGYIYIANNSGILEFDGSVWQSITLPGRQVPRSLGFDDKGNLYAGGFETFGICRDKGKHKFTYQDLLQLHQVELEKEEVWHILMHSDKVFFQSFSKLFVLENGRISPITPPGNIMFLREVRGRLWVQVIDDGIYELTEDHTFRLLPGTQEKLSTEAVAFLLEGRHAKEIWIGTQSGGIFLYEEGNLEPWTHPLNQELQRNQLNKGLRLHDGSWVFGTVLNGLYIFDRNLQMQHHFNKSSGLQNNTVLSLFEDVDHNLWVGLDRGLNLINLASPFSFYLDDRGEIGSVYCALLRKDTLYLGTNQGLFFKHLSNNTPDFTLVQGTQGQVWDLIDKEGILCGHNRGTYAIAGGKANLISEHAGGWQFLEIPGREDVLLQSTYSGILTFRREKNGTWKTGEKLQGFYEPCRQILMDTSGDIWAAHPKRGIYQLRADSSYTILTSLNEFVLPEASDGLSHSSLFLKDGQIGIKGKKLYMYDASLNNFTETASPLANNDETILWWELWNDLIFLRKGTHFFVELGKKLEFLPNIQLIEGYEKIISIPFKEEDYFFFCLDNGFALVGQHALQSGLPKVARVPVHFKHATASDPRRPEGATLDLFREEKIPYTYRQIVFQVAKPGFETPPYFRYRLNGYQAQWADYTQNSTIALQNLPAGSYELEVQELSSRESIKHSFVILAPWYATRMAYLLYALLLAGISIGILKYLGYRLKKQAADFERRRKDEEQLRLQREKEMSMQQEIDQKSRELAHAALSQVRKNEILNQIKSELISIIKDPAKKKHLTLMIDEHLESDQEWDNFVEVFNHVHDDFFKKLQQQYPHLTIGDFKLAAYLRLNLSTKEIAPLLNLSVRSVENKRYRLRKKLDLPEDANLTEFIMGV